MTCLILGWMVMRQQHSIAVAIITCMHVKIEILVTHHSRTSCHTVFMAVAISCSSCWHKFISFPRYRLMTARRLSSPTVLTSTMKCGMMVDIHLLGHH